MSLWYHFGAEVFIVLNSIPVIPKPHQIIESGGYFILNPESGVAFDEHAVKSAEYLCDYTGLKADSEGSVRFVYDDTLVEGMRMSNLVTQAVSEDQRKKDKSGRGEEE